MADRSTARAFCTTFTILAKWAAAAQETGDLEAVRVLRAAAEEIYDEQDGGGFDYTPDQMDADEALVTLGLAIYRPWREADPEADSDCYEDDEELICYRDED